MPGTVVCPAVMSMTAASWTAGAKLMRRARCHPAPVVMISITCGIRSVVMVPVMIRCARPAIINRVHVCWWHMGVM